MISHVIFRNCYVSARPCPTPPGPAPHSERVYIDKRNSYVALRDRSARADPSVIHEIYVARKQPKTLTAFGKQLPYAFPVALAYVASV